MTEIDTQIEAARRQAAAAQTQVAAISSRLLAKLLKLSHRQAANHIRDRRLTPADRTALLAHLQKQLPTRPQTRNTPSRPTLLKLRSLLVWLLGHQVAVAGCAALTIVVGVAWANTPPIIGVGRLAYDFEARWPDGSAQTLQGTYAVLGRDGSEWLIRVWRPFKGYTTARVPSDALYAAQ